MLIPQQYPGQGDGSGTLCGLCGVDFERRAIPRQYLGKTSAGDGSGADWGWPRIKEVYSTAKRAPQFVRFSLRKMAFGFTCG